ncbi:Contactin [Intoshia linei]|uniref:Contactin n=1 Tax=Intoshia linei TaxID=1819745 RepID=A0A177AX80_9BILA|nr:Contactin [Intoshia linei]
MWSKQINGKRLFLRPHLNPHIFISKNGKLFFSSVNREDQANYTCFVKLNLKDKLVFQGKISRPIEVFVDKAVSFIKEPVIALGFPNIYPKNPKLNDDIIIECIAYGRIPLKYGWSKVNGELPKNRYRLTDNDRVLHINSIELFDSGYYRCRVERINGRSTYGDVLVNINVQPIFTLEINDQFLPEGSQFNWKCEAIGQDVIYTWYHNAKLIQTDKNCLMKLQNFSSRHTGIYRTCAENSHGKVCISAELRLINLTKYTYHDIRYEGIGSKKNIYDLCEISAMERGLINVHNVGGVIKNIEIGNNFNQTLPISQKYQCLFNNFYESFVVNYETIKIDKPIISKPYSDVVVNAGDNVTLQCQVSTPPILDVAYNWFYYDKKIEFERYYTRYDRFYIINDERYDRLHGFDNTLKINRVSHRSSGQYTCVTYFGLFMDSLRASTNLQVKDKPFCPYGVKIGGVGSTVAEIKWRMGNDGGYSVDYFTIDLTIDGGIKWYFKKNVTASITNVFKNLITELEPNTSYNFRVDAVNKLGSSNNCEKSEMIVTATASPEGVVPLIYGGGGKEGTLVIKWIPPKIGEFKYILYYKQENIKDDTWNEVRIENSKSTKYVVTVGKTNSYKPYMVAISVFNEHGIGPKSKKFKIMSSEYCNHFYLFSVKNNFAFTFPTGIPQTTVATQLNSTSLLVFWKEPKEQQDKNSNYSIGYRINYWRTKTENEYVALFLIVHNQLNGTIVGLDSNTLYSVNIQVFNSAGYSSKSNTYEERTLRKGETIMISSPQYQPTNVMIQLIPTNKVKVIWRGVSTKLDEEPLKGYTIRMWREYTDYEIAIDIDVRKQTSYVLNAITPNVMYNLRVFAYSRGGQGQMSYPVSKFRIIGFVWVFQNWRVSYVLCINQCFSVVCHCPQPNIIEKI